MATSKRADVVVGIDFGMTCSGVAYSMGPEWPDPKTIQRWPGKLGHEIRNKVETSVSYDINTGKLATWGFLCNPDDERFEYNTFFKLHLDPNHKDAAPDPPTNEDAQRWFQDYMSCLYHSIIKHFTDTIPRFMTKRIDFVFSVPVTWRTNPALLADIERLIHNAGFGSREKETANVYLTEAEAAAIYASKQTMNKGEVFLVCDAGGGTTDLNVLKVESAARGNFELVPMAWTEGAAIGSTLIDYKIRILVKERLALIQDEIQGDIEDVATQMLLDKFETFKCSFGSPGMDLPRLLLPIPGINPGLHLPQAGIEDSKLVVTRAELQAVFDHQVDRMCNLIDNQLKLVKNRHAGEAVQYLVLSGGLGSSPYVQTRIKARYERGSGGMDGLQVLVASEPQLAVVHGLVAAKIQANRGGPDMFATRCCPISLGILCRELYDPKRHQGEMVVEDAFDKKRWAERQINWIIKQGQVVKADYGVNQPYCLKIPMGKEKEPWQTHIVMSSLPANQLPRSMKQDGAREVCAIETVLDQRDMKRKNRHWYQFAKEYNRAEFHVRMIVGTGLRFEVWSMDGIRSRDHDEIEVHWEPADGRIPAPEEAGVEGYQIYQREL